MSPNVSFIENCLMGLSLPDEVDDYVGRWHADESIHLNLGEYLGLSDDEYEVWMLDASLLPTILAARKNHIALQDYLSKLNELPLAARGSELSRSSPVIKWLRSTGRIK